MNVLGWAWDDENILPQSPKYKRVVLGIRKGVMAMMTVSFFCMQRKEERRHLLPFSFFSFVLVPPFGGSHLGQQSPPLEFSIRKAQLVLGLKGMEERVGENKNSRKLIRDGKKKKKS